MASDDTLPIALFIGLTQNGKSSVIRSILKYAGDEEQAAKVQLGWDSLSTTKDVTEYPVVVPHKEHHLRYTDGRGRLPLVDEEVERDEVELEEVDLGGSMRVRLMDSPGLSDSGTPMPEKATDDEPPPRKMEDEKHKLKVLRALSAASRINSVCFVVKRTQAFGWDFRRHITDYVGIFRLAGILDHVNFHVLHTQIDLSYRFKLLDDRDDVNSVDDEWEDEPDEAKLWITERAEAFDRVAGVKATHHWMNNQPSVTDPIAQYFSKRAISQLMQALSADSSTSCPNLRYPKGELHKQHDKDVRTSYDSLVYRLNAEKRRLASELTDLERDIRPKISRRDGLRAEIDKLVPKIQLLDTTELEVVGKESRYKAAKWDNWEPTLYFRIDASATIRKIERSPESPTDARWIVQSSTDDHYYADYQANTFSNASATIVLKGYKKDVHAEEIQKYQRQRDGFQGNLKKVDEGIAPIEKEIREKKARTEQIESEIDTLQQEKSKLDGESFLLQTFSERSALFLSGGLYSICQGYGLRTTVLKSKLPRHFLDKEEVNSELWALKRKENKMFQASLQVFEVLQQDLERKSAIREELVAFHERTRVQLDTVGERIEGNTAYDLSESANGQVNEMLEESEDFEMAIGKLQDKCHQVNEKVDGVLVPTYTRFESFLQWSTETVEKLKKTIANATAANETYERIVRTHSINGVAIEKVMEYFNDDEVSIGAFTILFNAIQKKLTNPYLKLYEEIAIYLEGTVGDDTDSENEWESDLESNS